jgi:hypothetical protein
MTIILSFSDTASLSSVMLCCTTVAVFKESLLVELEACTDRRFYQMLLLHGGPQAFLICLRCMWLLVLRVLMQ